MIFEPDEDHPKLETGRTIVFQTPIRFGAFTAKRFVVLDPVHLKFRARDEDGPVCKILPTFFRIYEWEIEQAAVSLASETPTEPEQLSLFC